MGTWGPGNLDSDSTHDILSEQSHKLIEETLELAASEEAAQYDEYDYDKLFVNFETIFALQRSHLLLYYPEPEAAISCKHTYLARWDAYAKKNKAEWDERRAVIAKTFDRLIWICQRQKEYEESGPVWVEIKAPTIEELAPDIGFMPHLIFDNVHLSLPTSWKTALWNDARNLPQSSLTGGLIAKDSGLYTIKDHQFRIERVFYASGESLAPDLVAPADGPYLLMARLKAASDEPAARTYSLVCDTEKALSPGFQAAGQHVSGVYCLDTLQGFDFDGLEAFRHVKSGPEWGTQLRSQHLYYHPLSENTLLLLEFGSIRDNINLHFPDKVLLDRIVESLRNAAKG